jgi:hypothetical protein
MASSNELDILRRALGEPLPGAEQRASARTRLDAVINVELSAGRHPGRRQRLTMIAVAAALTVVAAVVLVMVSSGEPASALEALARVARQVDPIEVPPGAFAYTRSEHVALVGGPGDQFPGIDDEQVAYLLPTTRESWTRSDGFVQLVTTNNPPIFFDPRVEAAYYQAGHDRIDGVGDTVISVFGEVEDAFAGVEWPTDREELAGVLEEWVHLGPGEPPREVQLLQLVAAILRERILEPDIRAALIEVLATLDFQVTAANNIVTVTVDYQQQAPLRYSVSLDGEANLRSESTTLLDTTDEPHIPAGTVISRATYTPPVIVPDLQPPE